MKLETERPTGARVEPKRILVWDLPVRVFHWMLALSFAGAFVTAESEHWRDVHVALGYTVAGLLAFRLIWGFMGSRYARFGSFAFGPKAVLAYLGSLLRRDPSRHVGHNPAGSWAIYAIVTLGIVVSASGYAVYNATGGKWLESLHEGASNAMLALVVVHIAGVIASSLAHRENLVASMLTGYKRGQPHEAIGRTRWVTAVLLAGFVAALWSGIFGTPGSTAPGTAEAAAQQGERRPLHDREHGLGERDG